MNEHQKYKAVKHLLLSAKFEVKGEAVNAMASLFSWFDSLEGRFIEKPLPKIEPIKKTIGGKNANK